MEDDAPVLDALAHDGAGSGADQADTEDRHCGRRLASEQRQFTSDPPEGIEAAPLNRRRSRWVASFIGPQGSPYEGRERSGAVPEERQYFCLQVGSSFSTSRFRATIHSVLPLSLS